MKFVMSSLVERKGSSHMLLARRARGTALSLTVGLLLAVGASPAFGQEGAELPPDAVGQSTQEDASDVAPDSVKGDDAGRLEDPWVAKIRQKVFAEPKFNKAANLLAEVMESTSLRARPNVPPLAISAGLIRIREDLIQSGLDECARWAENDEFADAKAGLEGMSTFLHGCWPQMFDEDPSVKKTALRAIDEKAAELVEIAAKAAPRVAAARRQQQAAAARQKREVEQKVALQRKAVLQAVLRSDKRTILAGFGRLNTIDKGSDHKSAMASEAWNKLRQGAVRTGEAMIIGGEIETVTDHGMIVLVRSGLEAYEGMMIGSFMGQITKPDLSPVRVYVESGKQAGVVDGEKVLFGVRVTGTYRYTTVMGASATIRKVRLTTRLE